MADQIKCFVRQAVQDSWRGLRSCLFLQTLLLWRSAADKGFSLLETIVGGSIMIAAGYAFYNVSTTHENSVKDLDIGSELRSDLRVVLEEVSGLSSFHFPHLGGSSDGTKINVYYQCSHHQRKQYQRAGQKSENLRKQKNIRKTKNIDGEVGIGILMESDLNVAEDSCNKVIPQKLFTADSLAPEHHSDLISCLAKGHKIPLESDLNDCGAEGCLKICPSSNVVTFFYPFEKTPHVLAWSFKIDQEKINNSYRFIRTRKVVTEWVVASH